MISHAHVLDRKIKGSNLEEIYERLHIPKTDRGFAEILAEFGREIANNPLFERYARNIGKIEKTYREKPEIATTIRNATYTPTDQQALAQQSLIRTESLSEYFSLWLILRFNELYDIPAHDRMRNELIKSSNFRDLCDFEEGVIVISNILEGNSNANLADYYLPHVHRAMCGIIRFFDKKKLMHVNDDNDDNNAVDQLNKPSTITRLEFKKKKSILLVDGKKHPINTPLQLRYISLFFKTDGSPKKKKFPDDEIHSYVFSSDVVTRNSEFKKEEKDQVAGLKRHFKAIIKVKNRTHSIKTEYLN